MQSLYPDSVLIVAAIGPQNCPTPIWLSRYQGYMFWNIRVTLSGIRSFRFVTFHVANHQVLLSHWICQSNTTTLWLVFGKFNNLAEITFDEQSLHSQSTHTVSSLSSANSLKPAPRQFRKKNKFKKRFTENFRWKLDSFTTFCPEKNPQKSKNHTLVKFVPKIVLSEKKLVLQKSLLHSQGNEINSEKKSPNKLSLEQPLATGRPNANRNEKPLFSRRTSKNQMIITIALYVDRVRCEAHTKNAPFRFRAINVDNTNIGNEW